MKKKKEHVVPTLESIAEQWAKSQIQLLSGLLMIFVDWRAFSIALRPLMSSKGNSVCTGAALGALFLNCQKNLPDFSSTGAASASSNKNVNAFLHFNHRCQHMHPP